MTSIIDASGLVLVDKPAGMTSHDVVSKLRRAFHTKRVGHAGTLDPMATGVLVVGIERGTKFLAHMVASTKSYDATIRLGWGTTTEDAEGTCTEVADAARIEGIDAAMLYDARDTLVGEILQRPSSVSAIKINGKRAYELVRNGEEVEIPARPVTIHSFDIHSSTPTTAEVEATGETRTVPVIDIEVSVSCSSGTYIRALGRDLGLALGVPAHLTQLRRTSVGVFDLSQAAPLEQVVEAPELSLNLDDAMRATFPVLEVTEAEGKALAMGKWLEPRGLKGVHAACTPDGHAIALVKEKGKRLSSVFVARPSTL